MKKIAYFICFLYVSVLNSVDIDIGSIEKHKDKLIVHLNVDIDESEMIYKDDILISVDSKDIIVEDFQIINYSQEEVSLSKTKKKAYRNPFIAKIFLTGLRQAGVAKAYGGQGFDVQDLNILDIYFSCFLVDESEKFDPFIKKISVEFGNNLFSLSNLRKKSTQKFKAKIQNAYTALKKPVKKMGTCIFDARILTLLLVIILFMSFILFSVLSIGDLLIILLVFTWGYFSGFVFMREISFFFLAILLLISSVWFFSNYVHGKSLLQKTIRLLLAFLCVSLILPIFLEIYLSRCFENRIGKFEILIKR